MDALRVSDSLLVALKRVKASSNEAQVSRMFSSEAHTRNPLNQCIPLLQVLQVPGSDDEAVLVMKWMRPVKSPRFRTLGEVLQFLRETLQV